MFQYKTNIITLNKHTVPRITKSIVGPYLTYVVAPSVLTPRLANRYEHIREEASTAGSPSVMEVPVVQMKALGMIRASESSFGSTAFVRTFLHTPALIVQRI